MTASLTDDVSILSICVLSVSRYTERMCYRDESIYKMRNIRMYSYVVFFLSGNDIEDAKFLVVFFFLNEIGAKL